MENTVKTTEGWDLLVGEEVSRVEYDGEDVLLHYANGAIVRAKSAKAIAFQMECLPDPDYT
jgi:hypothetical protein